MQMGSHNHSMAKRHEMAAGNKLPNQPFYAWQLLNDHEVALCMAEVNRAAYRQRSARKRIGVCVSATLEQPITFTANPSRSLLLAPALLFS